jgi:hypothetical protein
VGSGADRGRAGGQVSRLARPAEIAAGHCKRLFYTHAKLCVTNIYIPQTKNELDLGSDRTSFMIKQLVNAIIQMEEIVINHMYHPHFQSISEEIF